MPSVLWRLKMETKKCSKCGEVKSLSDFYKRYGMCKECASIQQREYRLKNAEKRIKYNKEYRLKNAERIREQKREYRLKNAERIREYDKKYSSENIEKIRKREKKNNYNLTNKYIASLLRISIKDVPKELLEAKRAQIKIHRLLKQQ